MPTYTHKCKNCGHRWDEFYSMNDDPPTLCPSCGKDGDVMRVITGGSGPGIMSLKGGDLRSKIMSDAAEMRKRAVTDEKFRANLYGEEAYHRHALSKDSLEKELLKIGKDASKIKSTDVKSETTPQKKGSFKRSETKSDGKS